MNSKRKLEKRSDFVYTFPTARIIRDMYHFKVKEVKNLGHQSYGRLQNVP